MTVSDTRPYRQNPAVIATDVNGEVVLLHPAAWDYFEFNKVGSAVWRLLATPMTLEALVTALTSEFDVEPRRCRDETTAMLARLEQHGLIIHDRPAETAMAVTMYGIKNCDTIKKARTWLEGQGVAYDFHDYKAAGIDADRLRGWAGQVGWEVLLNRAGTTFRALPDADKTGRDVATGIALMVAQPSMNKRPVLESTGSLLVGFKPDTYLAAGLGR
jgi:arsenate reductase